MPMPAVNWTKRKKRKAKQVAVAILLLKKASQNLLVANFKIFIIVKILYIFPIPMMNHLALPGAIHWQVMAGHEVHLLTLTKGGATQARHKLNLSIEHMGEVRYREMRKVEKVLQLSSMTVLNFEDSGLKELDPRRLESEVSRHIQKIQPWCRGLARVRTFWLWI